MTNCANCNHSGEGWAQTRHAKQCKNSVGEHTMTKQIYMLIVMACLLNLSVAVSSMADEVKHENARNCILTRSLKSTAVVDDMNILFIKVGKTIYHNILPRQCQGLSRTRSFSYTTLSGSLCIFDTIQIIDRHGRQEPGLCQSCTNSQL